MVWRAVVQNEYAHIDTRLRKDAFNAFLQEMGIVVAWNYDINTLQTSSSMRSVSLLD